MFDFITFLYLYTIYYLSRCFVLKSKRRPNVNKRVMLIIHDLNRHKQHEMVTSNNEAVSNCQIMLGGNPL